MPMPITLAHQLAERLAAVRKDGTLAYLRPDGKTQVRCATADGRPVAVEKLLISTQHAESVTIEQIRADLWERSSCRSSPTELLDTRRGAIGQPDRSLRDRRPGRRLRA